MTENNGKYDIFKNDKTGLLAVREGRTLAEHGVTQNLLPTADGKLLIGDMNDLVKETRKKVNTRPIVYFWIIEFGDGVAISQFDPFTGNENSFGEQVIPRADKITKAGWYPFSQKLLDKISFPAIALPVPIHRVEVLSGKELVIFRRNRIHYGGGLARGKSEYFLGIRGEHVMRIFENGEYEMSLDYKGAPGLDGK